MILLVRLLYLSISSRCSLLSHFTELLKFGDDLPRGRFFRPLTSLCPSFLSGLFLWLTNFRHD
jgi:hypothetical protein